MPKPARPSGAEPVDSRRVQMLEAAAQLIAERGLARTRIADVAERVGASPGWRESTPSRPSSAS